MNLQGLEKYQIEAVISKKYQPGKITYQGQEKETGLKVVIKQFCFARKNSSWAEYEKLENEINILQKLNHSHVPKYIEHIETSNGICLITEYLDALNCKEQKLDKFEVSLLIQQILRILIYLETKNIVHKDIKLSNILWDKKNYKAYLVNFGFSVFVSPQFLLFEENPAQIDLRSLGKILYILLSRIKNQQIDLDFPDIISVDSFRGIVGTYPIKWLKSILEGDFNSPKNALNELGNLLDRNQKKSRNQSKNQPWKRILSFTK